MKTRIDRLEAEKIETRGLREKYHREMELNEDQWRKEVNEKKNYFFIYKIRVFFLGR